MSKYSNYKFSSRIIYAILLLCYGIIVTRAEAQTQPNIPTIPFVGSNAQLGHEVKAFKDCPHCPEMVVVRAGSFEMGSMDAEIDSALSDVPSGNGPFGMLALFGASDQQMAKRFMAAEKPKHTVRIPKDFALGRFPITREEFGAFVKDTGYQTGLCLIFGHSRPIRRSNTWADPDYVQTDRDPVVCVTWNDAQVYIRWLNKKISKDGAVETEGPYRLPSEAEWEYSARSGSQTEFPWGTQIGVDNALCFGCNGDQKLSDGRVVHSRFASPPAGTLPVGTFSPNGFGLYDMIGNVAEPTADCWHNNYLGAPTDGTAWINADCPRRTERGDSWRGPTWAARSATRGGDTQSEVIYDRGFRVAKTIE